MSESSSQLATVTGAMTSSPFSASSISSYRRVPLSTLVVLPSPAQPILKPYQKQANSPIAPAPTHPPNASSAPSPPPPISTTSHPYNHTPTLPSPPRLLETPSQPFSVPNSYPTTIINNNPKLTSHLLPKYSQELIRMGVGTMRKREINEGKAYEADGSEDALLANAASAAAASIAVGGSKRGKKK
jgi:hypothetical protein